MFLRHLTLLVFLAAYSPAHAQPPLLRGQSFETVLHAAGLRDSVRIWHRYVTDSNLVLLIPREANPWLRRGYEFRVPIGRISNPVALAVRLVNRDSLWLSCTASDYFSSGYRILFCREPGGFCFRSEADFQIFRSGVERICSVPVRLEDKPDRRIIIPAAGANSCWFVYHRQLIAELPNSRYALP